MPIEYVKGYGVNDNLNLAYAKLQQGMTSDFQQKDGIMYKGTQLCILEDGDKLQWTWEAHTSKEAWHFRV